MLAVLCAAPAKHRDRVTRLLDDALMQAPTATWIERLSGKVPVAPVFDIAQALENPFVHERDGVLAFDYGDGRGARMIANPIRIDGVALPHRAAPRMGEHDDQMLREAGFDGAAIARLRASSAASPDARIAPAGVEHEAAHDCWPRRSDARREGPKFLFTSTDSAASTLDGDAAADAADAGRGFGSDDRAGGRRAGAARALRAPARSRSASTSLSSIWSRCCRASSALPWSSTGGRSAPARSRSSSAPPASPSSAFRTCAASSAGALPIGAGYGPTGTPASSEILGAHDAARALRRDGVLGQADRRSGSAASSPAWPCPA